MDSITNKKQIKNELDELSIKYLNKFLEFDEPAIVGGLQDKEAFMIAFRSPLGFADMLLTAVRCSMAIDGFTEKFAKLMESELDKHAPGSCDHQ